MNITASKVEKSDIMPLRAQFLEEADCQIRYEACHARNWSDAYHIYAGHTLIGYGSVKGLDDLMKRNTIFEFYIQPAYRNRSAAAFSELVKVSGVKYVESQSNEKILTAMLQEFCYGIESDILLFEDRRVTHLEGTALQFRKRKASDPVFGDDRGDYVLLRNKEVVATGGFMTHYNPPYADVFMEVRPDCRRQGLGAYIVQEIKQQCYQQGKRPAARCRQSNHASKATLLKAGFGICGRMLKGQLKQ
jgi:GNAT superfamily N-acetyltransferase